MEQYIDEYLRNIFGSSLLEADDKTTEPKPSLKQRVGKYGQQAGEKVGSTLSTAGSWVSKKAGEHPLGTAATIGGLALGAGYLAHKKYLSAAARSCSQYSGRQKEACIAKYRAGGFRAEMLSLKENSIICNESPDKDSCFKLVSLRIIELQEGIKRLK